MALYPPFALQRPRHSAHYWRKAWEAKPFLDLPKLPAMASEDVCFQSGLKVAAESSIFRGPKLDPSIIWEAGLKLVAASSLTCHRPLPEIAPGAVIHEDCEPRMIASVHGSNTQSENYRSIGVAHEFKRVPEWDAYCRERMRL